MQVQPYLDFDGRCDEAIEFYKRALGAEVKALHRFKESPPGTCPPGSEEKVMHAHLVIGDAVLLASDGYCQGQKSFQGFSLALNLADETKAEQLFSALSDGGQVKMPLTKTFFASRFGMVADRFGVTWMIHVAA